MKDLNCCGKIIEPVRNTKALWRARDAGMTEEEAQEASIVCFLCESCMTVYEESECGKLFVVHLPSGKEAEL